jgi:aldose 1-epimerase
LIRTARARFGGAIVACAAACAAIVLGGCANHQKSATPPSAATAQSSAAAPSHPLDWFDKKEKPMPHVTQSDFGKTADGKPVALYTLTNSNGLVAKVMTYGATLTEMRTPDSVGKMGDIVLGFDNLPDYLAQAQFFGATAGRVANRIAKGEFQLDGETYQLAINNGPNTLHGGKIGFDKKIWDAQIVKGHEGVAVQFHYVSPNMEENFPGNLDVTVTYTLTEKDELRIDYKATTDKATILNLTNHSYWNLSAFALPTILNEVAYINADRFTPVDDTLIPTGRLQPVLGTPFDFTAPTAIGARIEKVPGGPPTGYDHNFVLNGEAGKLKLAAKVYDPETGRQLEVWTTEPGVQFYTSNFLDGSIVGIGGHHYGLHAAFCLETQHFPDSIHHPEFPSTVLQPGQVYTQTTIHKFSVR